MFVCCFKVCYEMSILNVVYSVTMETKKTTNLCLFYQILMSFSAIQQTPICIMCSGNVCWKEISYYTKIYVLMYILYDYCIYVTVQKCYYKWKLGWTNWTYSVYNGSNSGDFSWVHEWDFCQIQIVKLKLFSVIKTMIFFADTTFLLHLSS